MSETIITNASRAGGPRGPRHGGAHAAGYRGGRYWPLVGAGRVDVEGDYLAPGLIEMHTDNAEKHFEPRPGVIWPDALAAMLAHDAQLAAAGVTTVYDSVCAGYDSGKQAEIFARSIRAIDQGVAAGAFRTEHRIHIRCELTGDDLIEVISPFSGRPLVQLVSLMDHTPGQRQWRDLEAMRRYHLGTRRGISFAVSPTDRARLTALIKDRNSPQKHVWRAEIVLFSADGVGTAEIMRRTGKSKTCVWRWQERFAEEGFAGLLRDKTRPSRIPPLGPKIAERVVTLTLADPPGETTHWTPASAPARSGAFGRHTAAAAPLAAVQALQRSPVRR